jgi:hypothetical protein
MSSYEAGKNTLMRGHFSFRHRLVMCERCQRPVAADLAVCPHCDHHRLPQSAFVPRLPAPAGYVATQPVMIVMREATARIPLRVAMVCVMAMLAVSGYVCLRESNLDARLDERASHRWIASIDDCEFALAQIHEARPHYSAAVRNLLSLR